MGTPNTDTLMKFLNDYLVLFKEKDEYIETHEKRLKNVQLPTFELKPRDYLEFAENFLLWSWFISSFKIFQRLSAL